MKHESEKMKEEIARRFKEARIKLNKNNVNNNKPESVRAVAKALGLSASSILLYETGERIPYMENARKLADHYGVSVQWLLCESESPSFDDSFQAVSKLTGLSDDAIRNLQTIKAWRLSDALNTILESEDFINILERFEASRMIREYDTEEPEEGRLADQAYVNSIRDSGGRTSDFALLSKATQADMLLGSATQIFGNLLRNNMKGEK